MKATDWEFRNRALIFGLMFAFTFSLNALDHQNATAAAAEWLSSRVGLGADLLALVIGLRSLFVDRSCFYPHLGLCLSMLLSFKPPRFGELPLQLLD